MIRAAGNALHLKTASLKAFDEASARMAPFAVIPSNVQHAMHLQWTRCTARLLVTAGALTGAWST
jgi:hypothetical protein